MEEISPAQVALGVSLPLEREEREILYTKITEISLMVTLDMFSEAVEVLITFRGMSAFSTTL